MPFAHAASLTRAAGPTWPDGVHAGFEEHEESVYHVAWSAADPWIFASLSLDGRLVVNHVPTATKYGLLLAGTE